MSRSLSALRLALAWVREVLAHTGPHALAYAVPHPRLSNTGAVAARDALVLWIGLRLFCGRWLHAQHARIY
eukprot:565473-Pleurochrysis_carterae.AAC.8